MSLQPILAAILFGVAAAAATEENRPSRGALLRSEAIDGQLTTSSATNRALSRLRDHSSPRSKMHQLVFDSLISLSEKGMLAVNASAYAAALAHRTHVAQRRLQQACVPMNEEEPARGFAESAAFHQQVKDGVEFARSKRVVFAGLWHGSGDAESLARVHTALSAFGSFFQDHQIIMLEHAVDADTVKGMKSICDVDARAICFSLQGRGRAALDREAQGVRRSAMLRSALLQKSLEFDPTGLFDFLVVVDGDIFAPGSGGFDVGTALAALTLASPKGPVGAYDGATGGADAVCAFQLSGWTQDHFDARHMKGPACRYQRLEQSPMCLARSCGGGLALYSLASIREAGCDYDYYDHPTSEHVPFNECLWEKGHGRFFVYKPWAIPRNGPPRDHMASWRCVDI